MKQVLKLLLIITFFATIFVVSCGIAREIVHQDYRKAALLNYQAGYEEFIDENFEDAKFYFNIVIKKYPVSKYATLAQLRMADIAYLNDNFPEAAQSYARFRKEHPSHPCADYALYREALCYLMQAPENWWFMPPAEERDQQYVEQAYDTLRRFLIEEKALNNPPPEAQKTVDEERAFAESKVGFCNGEDEALKKAMITDAHVRLRWCAQRLLARELYVARFYLNRGKPKGAIMRLEGVLEDKRFVERGLDNTPEVLFLLVKASVESEDYNRACKYLHRLTSVSKQEADALTTEYKSLVGICAQK